MKNSTDISKEQAQWNLDIIWDDAKAENRPLTENENYWVGVYMEIINRPARFI